MTLALAIATKTARTALPTLETVGGFVGTLVSGSFLYAIGVLNLLVLVDLFRVFLRMRNGTHDPGGLEEKLRKRGFVSRFAGRYIGPVRRSWQVYPLGVLFGLGFDTASEVALLALAAGAASDGLSTTAIAVLPLLFAAGMSLLDTADGAFMLYAYDWAFSTPLRKIYYNLTVTGVSVAVALLVGTVEPLQVLANGLGLRGGFWTAARSIDTGNVGYAVVALFAFTWLVSYFSGRLVTSKNLGTSSRRSLRAPLVPTINANRRLHFRGNGIERTPQWVAGELVIVAISGNCTSRSSSSTRFDRIQSVVRAIRNFPWEASVRHRYRTRRFRTWPILYRSM